MSAPRIKDAIKFRSTIAFLVMAFVSLAIVGKVFYIQFIKGEELRRIAIQNQVQRIKVKASRGNIYANDGESLLATSLPFYKVAMDPTVCKGPIFYAKIDSLAMLLSRTFKDKSAIDYRDLLVQARKNDDRYLYVNNTYINFQTKKLMTSWPIFKLGKTKGGVIFEKIDKRYYPFQQLALRTVGYLNQDNGGAGLEFSFNKQLAGKNGLSIFQKIAGGNWKPIYEESKPKEGLDIITTLDVNLQDVAQTSLLKHLNMHNADHGCVVLMDVKSGEIRAMANLTRQGDSSYRETYNHAIKDKIEPGSTFKLASYMALLEEGTIRPEDSVFCENGKFKFYDRIMTDSKPEGYGKLTISDAFAKSSNVAISKLTVNHFKNQEKKFIDYLDAFGVTANLQFQMRGAERPYIKTPKDDSWSGITLPWMSVGYELQMTPIQTLALYNAVANDGKMIRPILVKAIREGNSDVETFKTSTLRDKICSDQTLTDIRGMLEAVVNHGTAVNIKNADYRIAGKTGTAQKLINGAYSKQYYTSFVGYFPAENPKFSCIVIIDNPKGYQQYGSDVAAPVFKELADKVYARDIEMHKELEIVENQNFVAAPAIRSGNLTDLTLICNQLGISNNAEAGIGQWVWGSSRGKGIRWETLAVRERKVPNVKGMLLRDALPLLENHGLRVSYTGHGKVVHQSVEAGSACGRGMGINLTLSY